MKPAPNVTLEGKLLKKVQAKGKITSTKVRQRVVFNPNRNVITDIGPSTVTRNGLYAHFCYEYDEMLIDETDPEFANCLCGTPNPKT